MITYQSFLCYATSLASGDIFSFEKDSPRYYLTSHQLITFGIIELSYHLNGKVYVASIPYSKKLWHHKPVRTSQLSLLTFKHKQNV